MLALALGRTIRELQAVMTRREFISWLEFYRVYPFDDAHRFHRPAALVASAMNGGDMQARIDWLQDEVVASDVSGADMSTLRAFGFKRKGG